MSPATIVHDGQAVRSALWYLAASAGLRANGWAGTFGSFHGEKSRTSG